MKPRSILAATSLVMTFGAFSAQPAVAGPIIGSQLFATGGSVVATFLGQAAAFTNDLYLFSASDLTTPLPVTVDVGPGYAQPGLIFTNHTSAPGSSRGLGAFLAGTELVFGIYVRDTGFTYFMGPAGRNPDGVLHGAVDDGNLPAFPGFLPPPAGSIAVGFEDLFGGGDLDYDDLGFAFSNVSPTPTQTSAPEPATLVLLGTGLVAAARRVRRRPSEM